MITYAVGDAANPTVRPVGVVHIVNDVGAWGRGFTANLPAWAGVDFRRWTRGEYNHRPDVAFHQLGNIHISVCPGDASFRVVHLCAQHGLRSRENPIPIDYMALDVCLMTLSRWDALPTFKLVMPRIGTGLAGGEWKHIEPLIEKHLGPFDVTVYDRPEGSSWK